MIKYIGENTGKEQVSRKKRLTMIFKNVKLGGVITDVEAENGKITHIGKKDGEGIDLLGAKIYPGLIDIHAHGCIGFDTMDEEDRLTEMSEHLLRQGTTAWYPTTMTMSKEDIARAVDRKTEGRRGAEILGFHMEGPHINPLFRGAMNDKYITRPDLSIPKEHPSIKMVTIAPELPGSREYIENCPAIVSVGHTDADYDTAMGAFRTGAKCLTHAFNAMNGIHHRAPGPLVAALDSEGVFVQLIADGIHIHPGVLRTYIRAIGTDRVVLISDSMRATGLSDGDYVFGGRRVTVRDGKALTDDGKLAGSTATLFECVKNIISFGFGEADAVKMASENPARLMGLNKGKIEVGYDADFIFTDESFNLIGVAKYGEFTRI